MPLMNYCRKCKAEMPVGELCPVCGQKLAKTNERISFGIVHIPVKDWFEWNRILRVGIPALLLVLFIATAVEWASGGFAVAMALLTGGLLSAVWIALGVMILCVGLMLWLQGGERVHYQLDKEGVHVRTYLPAVTPIRLYARFLSPAAVEKLVDDRGEPELTLIRHVQLPWEAVKRVRVWREGFTLLFYRPAFWQAITITCPWQEMENAEAYARKKLKKFKKVTFLPKEQ